ncbi:MAG: hypothetical protein EOM54_13135 [Clostridia bacterium]|nr:hypothetical protein [Clostridia bacterium]NCC67907.1 hypothetical protein [Clostridia bacterium]
MLFIKQNESEPLAYGFVENGNLYKKVKWPFTKEFCFYNNIGKDLVNFAWFGREALLEVFDIVFTTYVAARLKKLDYNFISSVILERCAPFFTKNSFFSLYLMSYIDFLLEDRLDLRVLTYINNEDRITLLAIHRDFPFDSGDYAKESVIGIFCRCIEAKQQDVAKTLEAVLLQRQSDTRSAIEQYYFNEQNDPSFRNNWHSDFTVMFGKRDESQDEVVQLTVLNTIDDILRYELVQLLTQGVEYKLCKNCGKLFIPSGRSDSLYCDRVMPGETKPCNMIGANIAAKKKVQDNPVLKLYRQAYQRMNKRMEFEYITPEEFADWNTPALEKREQCMDGTLSFEEYEAWIDSTSRQRKAPPNPEL